MPKGYKGRKKTERLHLLASLDEIQAIEDWQFKNRISSKGEAIRRLVQIGLRLERELPMLTKYNNALTKSITDVFAKLPSQSNVIDGEEQDPGTLVDIVLDRHLDSIRHLAMLFDEIAPLVLEGRFPNVSDALMQSGKTLAAVKSGKHKLQSM